MSCRPSTSGSRLGGQHRHDCTQLTRRWPAGRETLWELVAHLVGPSPTLVVCPSPSCPWAVVAPALHIAVVEQGTGVMSARVVIIVAVLLLPSWTSPPGLVLIKLEVCPTPSCFLCTQLGPAWTWCVVPPDCDHGGGGWAHPQHVGLERDVHGRPTHEPPLGVLVLMSGGEGPGPHLARRRTLPAAYP